MNATDKARREYRALQLKSGMTPAAFRADCLHLCYELADGEAEGEESFTPANWLRAASEIAGYAAADRQERDFDSITNAIKRCVTPDWHDARKGT